MKKTEYQNSPLKLEIYDTAGQERFKSINKTYYKQAFGALIIFDLTSAESFQDVSYYLRETRNHCDKGAKFMRVLAGNKLDLVNEDPERRAVPKEEVQNLIDYVNKNHKENIIYFETSAKDGTNINECFELFFQCLKEKIGQEIDEPSRPPAPIILKNSKETGKLDSKEKKCC